jgi:hypothetical protein
MIAGVFLVCACASSRESALLKTSPQESPEEAARALRGVAESYAGKPITDEELNDLARDLQNETEAQSAVSAIADSLEGKNTNIKYSPATGKRYSGDLEYDPETGVKLLPLEP